MRFVGIVLALLSAMATGAQAQNAAKNPPTTAKPVAALSWLIGGVWTADASKLGGGMQRIETRYEWSDNNAYVRFNTHFVSDRGTLHNYDGNFFWDPIRATLAVWYMDSQNQITQSPVKITGDVMTMQFPSTDQQGKVAYFRVHVTRKTNDRYGWLLEEKQGQNWKQLLALEYLRTPRA